MATTDFNIRLGSTIDLSNVEKQLTAFMKKWQSQPLNLVAGVGGLTGGVGGAGTGSTGTGGVALKGISDAQAEHLVQAIQETFGKSLATTLSTNLASIMADIVSPESIGDLSGVLSKELAQATSSKVVSDIKSKMTKTAAKAIEQQLEYKPQLSTAVGQLSLFGSPYEGMLGGLDLGTLGRGITQTSVQATQTASVMKALGKTWETATQSVNKYNVAQGETNKTLRDAYKEHHLLGQSIESAAGKFTAWYLISGVVTSVVNALKNVVAQVVELDKAFTSLQIVTQNTDAEMVKLRQSYIDLAKEMGVTVSTVTSGANEWLRAGLSVKETNDALRASLVLSTVAQMDSATATQYLVAAMNGFNLQASELIDLVDKLSAVDIVAATSSEELGQALSYSANSAQLAGLDLDKYIGMLATVSETTRQSASTIGNSFRSIFTRLQKVKIGATMDDEGQSISDVDTVLKQYGIDLMKVSNNLNDMGALLDELGDKWDTYTTVQKSQIATTIAGNYQRERFLVLMENYDRALELEQVALNSAGSATEKYTIYQESLEARLNSLSAAWTELANNTLNSGIVGFFIDAAKWIVELSSKTGGLIVTLGLLVTSIATVKQVLANIKAIKIAQELGTTASELKTAIQTSRKLGVAVDGLGESAVTAASKFSLLKVSISGALAVVTLIVSAIIGIKNAIESSLQAAIDIANKNVEATQDNLEVLQKIKNEYIELSQLENKTAAQTTKLANYTQQLKDTYGDLANNIDLVNGKYNTQLDLIKALATKELKQLTVELKAQQAAYEKSLGRYSMLSVPSAGGFYPGEQEHKPTTLWDQIAAEYDQIEGVVEKYDFLVEKYNELTEKRAEQGLSKQEQGALDKITASINEQKDSIDAYKASLAEVEKVEKRIAYYQSDLPNQVEELQAAIATFNRKSLEDQARLLNDIDAKVASILEDKNYAGNKEEIDNIVDSWRDLAETVRNTDFALLALNKKLAALKKQKEINEDELALQEKLLKVEQAREALAEAKNRRIRVFRAGIGFTYEEDAEQVQKAQASLDAAIKSAEQTDVDRAIAAVEKLQAMYEQAIIDQGTVGGKTVREAFLDQDFLAQWLNMSVAEKMAFLDQFITNKSWDAPLTPEDLTNWLPNNAGGTSNFGGGLSVVGEHGPEIVSLPRGSEILSNQRSRRLETLLSPALRVSGQRNTTLQFNGALNFPNVRNETDARGFVSELLKIGSQKIENFN